MYSKQQVLEMLQNIEVVLLSGDIEDTKVLIEELYQEISNKSVGSLK